MGRARGVRARRVSGIVRSRDESRRGKVSSREEKGESCKFVQVGRAFFCGEKMFEGELYFVYFFK